MRWYPYGRPEGEGVLLASGELATGGIWQIKVAKRDFGAAKRLAGYEQQRDRAHEVLGELDRPLVQCFNRSEMHARVGRGPQWRGLLTTVSMRSL